jgi:hypothetical protein
MLDEEVDRLRIDPMLSPSKEKLKPSGSQISFGINSDSECSDSSDDGSNTWMGIRVKKQFGLT